jgi:hypothetical protein
MRPIRGEDGENVPAQQQLETLKVGKEGVSGYETPQDAACSAYIGTAHAAVGPQKKCFVRSSTMTKR